MTGNNKQQIMIIAGEASGDLHASRVLHEYIQMHPDTVFFGVGGERMKAEGCELFYHVEEVSFLGLVEVLVHLPFIRKMMARLLEEYQRRRPDAIILVDYPGFNLRFADKIRRLPALENTPILYYISPQVWAWHASRVPQIARLVDRIAVIFDFEAPIYQKAGLQVDFVGHPLLEVTQPSVSREEFRTSLGLQPGMKLVGLLPGSRQQEVTRLLPVFIDTYKYLRHHIPDLRAAIGCSSTLEADLYDRFLANAGNPDGLTLLRGRTTDLQAYCDVALVKSGTSTLETAILGTPLVMAYKVAPLTYLAGRHLVKIPDIALVNVVAGKRVVPEFIQTDATPEKIGDEIIRLLEDETVRRTMQEELGRVRQKLGDPGASRKVAEILAEMVS